MKTKLFTRFICLVLAALCLPIQVASAAKGESGETTKTTTAVIDALSVYVELPAGGRAPSFFAYTESPDYRIATGFNYEYDSDYYHNFYKDGIQWYDLDNGRALKEGEAFVTGTRYRVDIGVAIPSGTDIWGIPYFSFADELFGFVNGNNCAVGKLRTNNDKYYRQLSFTFPPCEEAPDDIVYTSLWIDTPVAGAVPDYTYTTNGEGFMPGPGGTLSINGVVWYDSDSLDIVSADDTFKAGHSYTVAIELNAASPYLFATNSDGTSKVSAYINNNKATVYCTYQTVSDMDREIWVKYRFDACDTVVDSVEVMDFTLPKEGAKGNISMCSPDDSIYKVTGIVWKSKTETIAVWYDTGYRSQNGVFDKGVTYTVSVTLKASEGYRFATTTNGAPAVTASAGGFEFTTRLDDAAHPGENIIVVECSFICKQTYVDNVNIKNLELPMAGKYPDYSATSIGVGYRIETEREDASGNAYRKYGGISWYDLTEDRWLYSNEKFVKNHVYTVYIDIAADIENGWEFKVNSDGLSEIFAYVNDAQAITSSTGYNSQWYRYVEFTASCTEVYDGEDTPVGGYDKLLGDVTGDGKVNALDAAFVLRYDAGLIGPDKLVLSVADVTGDGKVNALDAAFILRYDAGLIPEL